MMAADSSVAAAVFAVEWSSFVHCVSGHTTDMYSKQSTTRLSLTLWSNNCNG